MSGLGPLRSTIFLVSQRFGSSAGGEAIKGQQYADELLRRGLDLVVFTHERSISALGGHLPERNLRIVKDGPFQRLIWFSRLLRPVLGIYFHLRVRQLVDAELSRTPNAIVHYISPVSPVEPRFPPNGPYIVMGPLTGNIYYPPGFKSRMSVTNHLRSRLHAAAQLAFGTFFGDKRRADALLVSGYERTRRSLRLAGCREDRMIDVVDAGVSPTILERPRIRHSGRNTRFVCSGRLVDHKGIDLAIRAVASADSAITLDIFGDGVERAKLERLSRALNLHDRVTFHGWLNRHEDLLDAYSHYRGYVFPSLAEANGIVMQEAMTIGLPVITMRWGGPANLADDQTAIYVEPTAEDQVVCEIARAMNRLSDDGSYAEDISKRARAYAEKRFTWPAVLESWSAAYHLARPTITTNRVA